MRLITTCLLFSPGASVLMGAKRETVSHVVIRRCALMVYLQGHDNPVRPESPTRTHRVSPDTQTRKRVTQSLSKTGAEAPVLFEKGF